MSRNTGPVWRISRRLNFSILETGEELRKRPYIPGQHGSKTKKVKLSNYGQQKDEMKGYINNLFKELYEYLNKAPFDSKELKTLLDKMKDR